MVKVADTNKRSGTRQPASPTRVATTLLFSLALGCSQEADDVCPEELPALTANDVGLKGWSKQGVQLHGTVFHIMTQQGTSLSGIKLQGVQLDGANLDGLRLDGSQLVGVIGDGQTVAGNSIVGATMTGQLSDGSTLPLRVDAAATLDGANSDAWAYAVSYRTDAGWSALCGTTGGAPVFAIPLAGTWNDQSGVAGGGSWTASGELFTLACRGAALAKCVEFGYAPWKTVGGVSLRDHHQACTRMVRADYCGDGTSWTRDGTLINIYDSLGLQADDAAWGTDAEWTPDGAICADRIRDFRDGRPGCLSELQSRACGDFSTGALLVDEYDKGCADDR